MMARCIPRPLLGAVAIALVFSGCLGTGGDAPPRPDRQTEVSVDHRPIAAASAPTRGVVGAPMVFDGRASTDAENGTLHFAWTLGDGARRAGALIHHVYDAAGVYNVTLNVTDAAQQSDIAVFMVTVTAPPSAGPLDFEPWSAAGALAVANPFMERFGRPVPFVGSPWPLVGGDRLADFQARSLGAGIDHALYQVQTPTNGSRLHFVLEWDPVATLPPIDTVVDLDLFVFDPDGGMLPDGFTAATGNEPETFVVESDEHLARGTYQVLVLLFRGADVDYAVRATLTATPVGGTTTA